MHLQITATLWLHVSSGRCEKGGRSGTGKWEDWVGEGGNGGVGGNGWHTPSDAKVGKIHGQRRAPGASEQSPKHGRVARLLADDALAAPLTPSMGKKFGGGDGKRTRLVCV